MKKEKLKILIIRHNEEPELAEILNDYRAMQSIVDGHFAFMPFDKENEDCELMVNDEYLLNGSEFNRYIQSDFHSAANGEATAYGVQINGVFAVIRNNLATGEMISLTESDIAKYRQRFML